MTRPTSAAATVSYRAFDPARDYPAATQLVVESHTHDHVDWLPTVAVLRHEFEHSTNFRPAVDARVAERDGSLVGLVTAEWRPRDAKIVHHVELWVHPTARRQGIGTDLLDWAERHEADRVRAGEGGPPDLPHEIGGGADADVVGHAQVAGKRGYRVVRFFMEMRRTLDLPIAAAPLPAGLEIRPVREADHRAIWDADVEAFRDHWEASERSELDFVGWFSRPHMDTSLWQVAWAGDEVAGSVIPFVDPDENQRLGIRRGWLEHISVRRPWRQRGVATALIAAALHVLREQGLEEAALGVDAENPSGAVRVYERQGFRRFKTGVAYRKDLPR
jgi:mycothiol synthase